MGYNVAFLSLKALEKYTLMFAEVMEVMEVTVAMERMLHTLLQQQ